MPTAMAIFAKLAYAKIAKPHPSTKTAIRTRLLFCLLIVLLAGCTWQAPAPRGFPPLGAAAAAGVEQPVTVIPLQGPLARRKAQLSGLAWYGDALILLPQHPEHLKNRLFYLSKQEIVAFLQGDTAGPLTPHPLPLLAGDLTARIPGFQGFEAIAFAGERAFLTVEAEAEQQMAGYLVAGRIKPDLSEMRLEPALLTGIAPQANVRNLSDEAIVLAGEQIVTLYEGNGWLINGSPVAHLFNPDDLQPLGAIPFPQIEYRITDATALDAANRFWAINQFFSGRRPLQWGPDPLAAKYGAGATHRLNPAVERLVEFQYSPTGITLVDAPPVQLQLLTETARNWEGIARLDDPEFNGFLLVTDQRPATMLAFVPSLRE